MLTAALDRPSAANLHERGEEPGLHVRRGGHLGRGRDAVAVEPHGVGVRPADVHPDDGVQAGPLSQEDRAEPLGDQRLGNPRLGCNRPDGEGERECVGVGDV